MAPEPKGSIHEVMGDNEEFSNDPVPENSGIITESEVIPKGVDVSDLNTLPLDSKPEMQPSTTRKGKGLRKWKRIDRDARKSINTGMVFVPQESPRSDVSSSKRVQYNVRKEKSEGSVSSTNAMVQTFDDLRLGGSENSVDQSSKSSTAASALKCRQEVPIDLGRIGSFGVENSRAGRVGSTKKARGDRRVNIEKENSHSSLESDSRSSNFLFVQGTHSAEDSRMRDERLKQVSDGPRGVYGGGYEAGLPREDVVADSSSEIKEERSENNGYSSDQGPLNESIFALQSAQEALEQELLQFQEIGKDIPVDDSISGTGTEFIIDEEQETGDLEKEVEELFKQKIEAEVEYKVISRTVQNLRVALVEEQKALSTEQTQILDKLEVAGNKAATLKKDAEKLEGICGEIGSVDEIMKLQNRACKYGSCFFVQLVLLVVILGFCMIHLSSSYEEVVPT